MRIDTNIFTQHNLARVKEPRFVFEVAFDSANTILGYFTSHADAALPGGGTVIASVLQSFSGTSQTLSPDQANSTIGNLSLSFTDLGRAVTTLLGGQLALGRSTRQQRVRAYMGYKGDVWADYTLIQTQMVTEISYARGAYTIKCQDIQRSLRQNIFVQSKSSLASSVAASELSVSCLAGAAILSVLSAADFPTSGSGTIRDYAAPASDNDAFTWAGKTATTLTGCAGVLAHAAGAVVCDATINVQDTSAFVAVAHGTSYSDAPSATVGYIQIDKEVCRWVSKTSTTFVLDRRGALNTVATAHPVDPVSTLDQRTKAVEYVYLELPALDLIYRILTGKDRFGAAALPVNWNLGVDLAYVRLADFTDPAKLDLWDPADDTQGFVVRFEDLRSQDGKKFIETELALLCGIFMPVYADGSLGCKRMTSVLPGAAYVAQLDESNVVSCGELVYDMTSLHNAIQISWNWEPLQGDFTRINVFLDQPSITVHKQAPTLKLQFRGLHGSRHSAAMLAGRFDIIRDRYTGPPYRLTTEVLHRFNALEVGDVTRTKLRTVRDFVANGTLDRSFEIQGISIDWMKGLSLKQFASTRAPSPLPATGDATVLTHAWYTSQGTQLVTGVGSLTITGSNPGHVTVGGTLAGNADATNAAAIYYYVGDLVIDPGVTVNLTQNAQLRVEGSLTVNGVLSGIGGGLPGATQPSAFTTNADMSATVLGTVGFLGTTYAQGAASVGISDNVIGAAQYTLFSYPGGVVAGKNSAVPSFNLTWDGVTLGGLPKDLRGTSGSLGGKFFGNNFVTFWGGAGGAGGAGCILVARNLSIGASGRIDLSGGDGASALFTINGGAGGAPGGLLVVLDGAAATATGLTDAGFVANNGVTPTNAGAVNYGPASAPLQLLSASDPTQYTSYYVGTSAASGYTRPTLSGARGGSRVQFVPGSQAVVADPAAAVLLSPISMGLVSGAAELLLTGFGVALSRIKVTWVPPSDDRVVGYDLQFKLSTDAVWQSAPSALGQGTTTAYLVGVIAGQAYDVRLRSAGATREVSPWVTITGFSVFNQLASLPANVTGFSASQQGVVVSFNWDQVSDYALKGYDIGFAPQGTTNWNLFEPLTEVAKGTEMTNASVPPGTWTFGIRARNLADQLSAAVTYFDLVVTNANPLVSQVAQEKDWLGVSVNFVRHWTGVLIPLSTKLPSDYPVISPPAAPTLGTTPGGTLALVTYFVKVTYVSPPGVVSPPAGETLASAETSQLVLLNNLLTVASPAPATGASAYNVYVSTTTGTETLQNAAPIPLGTSWTEPASGLVVGRALPTRNGTGFEPFDIFVPDPVSSASYTAPQVDIGYDDAVRVFATEAALMGPGQSGIPNLSLAIDTWLSAGSDLGTFMPWVLGTVTMRFLRSRLTLNTIVAGAVAYVTSFVPTVDKAPVIEHADSVTVGATGTAIVFPTPFHVVPNVQVTPISAGVTSASATAVTTTGFTAHVFNGASEVGGIINWVATGE